ncbi:MAG: tRNA (cytidine/uridine-2'-O-)-methyltransferase [Kiritimatiellia bacterium]|jgi:tRNA (cytidine/uridine-2'-O-)-methyltransferase
MSNTHERKVELPVRWPNPPLNIVLVEPKIPPNTGNIARLCAATSSTLHLVGPLGFEITDAKLKRAGLDYWSSVDVQTYENWGVFSEQVITPSSRMHLLSTAGQQSCYDITYASGDFLVFGSETEGLPDALLEQYPDRVIQIPILTDHVRSLNLATASGIVLYEALRQINLTES